MAFEKYIFANNNTPKMPIHTLMAILSEHLTSEKISSKTSTDCISAIQAVLTKADGKEIILSADEQNDILAVFTYIDASIKIETQSRRLDEIYRCCVLAEAGIWYDTEEKLRTRLGWIVPK